jgi:hypothetical protein
MTVPTTGAGGLSMDAQSAARMLHAVVDQLIVQ